MSDGAALSSVIGGTIALCIGIGLLCNWATSVSCAKVSELYGLEHHYEFLTGCQVRFHGEWVALQNYRAIEPVKR